MAMPFEYGPRAWQTSPAGLKWTVLASAVQTLLSLSTLAALSRLLTPADFGSAAITMLFVTAAQVLGHRSIGSDSVRHPGLTDRHAAAGLVLSAAADILPAAGFWCLAPAVARFSGELAVASVLKTLSLAIVIAGLGTIPESLWRRQIRFTALSAVEVLVPALGYGGVAVALTASGFGDRALVWGVIMRHGAHPAPVLAVIPRLPKPGLARQEAGEPRRRRLLVDCALQPGGPAGQPPDRRKLARGRVARLPHTGNGAVFALRRFRTGSRRSPVPCHGATPAPHEPPRRRLSPRRRDAVAPGTAVRPHGGSLRPEIVAVVPGAQ